METWFFFHDHDASVLWIDSIILVDCGSDTTFLFGPRVIFSSSSRPRPTIPRPRNCRPFSVFMVRFVTTVPGLKVVADYCFLQRGMGSFINHNGMAGGRGFVFLISILLHKPYLVKWSSKREGVKNGQNNCSHGL